MKNFILLVCFIGLGVTAMAERPFYDPHLKFDGAKVASPVDVKRVAGAHYYSKTRSLDAQERIGNISIIDLGYDVPGFAAEGDRIWQAYVLRSRPRPNMLLGIIWIHPETEKVHFVTGFWDYKKQEQPPQPNVQGSEKKGNGN